MIEHMRQETRAVDQLFDGRGTITETAPAAGLPGTVAVRIDGGLVGWGTSFRSALRATQDKQVVVRRLDEAFAAGERRAQQRDLDVPPLEAPTDHPPGLGSSGR